MEKNTETKNVLSTDSGVSKKLAYEYTKRYNAKVTNYIEGCRHELNKLKEAGAQENRINHYIGRIKACDTAINIIDLNFIDINMDHVKKMHTDCIEKNNFTKAALFQGMYRGYEDCRKFINDCIEDSFASIGCDAPSEINKNDFMATFDYTIIDSLRTMLARILSKQYETINPALRDNVVSVNHIKSVFADMGVTIDEEPKF